MSHACIRLPTLVPHTYGVFEKLGDWAKPAMLIGYAQHQRAYKLQDFKPGRVIVFHGVLFDELSPSALNTRYDSCNNEKMIYSLKLS